MIKKLTGALSLTLMATTAMAGGLERSNQSVGIIFESGDYAEFSFGIVRPNVTGTQSLGGAPSGDMAGDYSPVAFGLKMDVTEDVSVALVVDSPYGGDVSYPTGTGYALAGTTADVNSQALTAIARYQMNENFSAYAGVRTQRVDGDVAITGGYTLDVSQGSGTGYLVGAAYEIPEIALRASLTYNSAIDHTQSVTESGVGTYNLSFKTPKSWHLEAQSGIAEDTLLFGSVRWVNWSDFALTPTGFALANGGASLLSYSNDVTTYTLGVGRRLNDNWSVSVSARHEKAEGGFSGNFGPNDGSTGLTIGARYTQDNITVSGGINYTWLGDTNTVLNAAPLITGAFTNNYAIGAGLKVGVHF